MYILCGDNWHFTAALEESEEKNNVDKKEKLWNSKTWVWYILCNKCLHREDMQDSDPIHNLVSDNQFYFDGHSTTRHPIAFPNVDLVLLSFCILWFNDLLSSDLPSNWHRIFYHEIPHTLWKEQEHLSNYFFVWEYY